MLEENVPNLRKDMPIKIHYAYRTPNRLCRKERPLSHTNQNIRSTKQIRNIKSCKWKSPEHIKEDLLELLAFQWRFQMWKGPEQLCYRL